MTNVMEFFIKAASIAYWGPICGSPKNANCQRKVLVIVMMMVMMVELIIFKFQSDDDGTDNADC